MRRYVTIYKYKEDEIDTQKFRGGIFQFKLFKKKVINIIIEIIIWESFCAEYLGFILIRTNNIYSMHTNEYILLFYYRNSICKALLIRVKNKKDRTRYLYQILY